MNPFRLFSKCLATLCLICYCFNHSIALAQQYLNQVTQIEVDTDGQLVLEVQGEGFDPLVQMTPIGEGQYQITVQADDAILSPLLAQNTTKLIEALSARIPAIEATQIVKSGQPLDSPSKKGGFKIVFTAWQKLQPQVKSNNGSRIVIALVGDHSLPATAVAQHKQAEAERQQTELKRKQAAEEAVRAAEALKKQQAEQKRQLELEQQAALERQEQLKHQQEIEAAARKAEALKKQQAEKLEQERQAEHERLAALEKQAMLKRQQEAQAASNLKRLQEEEVERKRKEEKRKQEAAHKQEAQKRAEAEAQQQAEIAVQKARATANTKQKQQTSLSAKQATLPSPPQVAQWQRAYRARQPLNVNADALDNDPIIALEMAQGLAKPYAPKKLTTDQVPDLNSGPNPAYPYTNEAESEPLPESPEEPIRLQPPPPDFNPDQGNFDWRPIEESEPQTRPSGSSGNSLYQFATHPNSPVAVRQAWQALMQGNPANAETTLRSYLGQSPNDSAARYLLARILLKSIVDGSAAQKSTTQREAARQELLKSINQTPYLPAYLTLIDLYLEDENFSDTSRLLSKAFSLFPNDAGLWFRQGQLAEAQNQTDAAREAYLKALAYQPENAEVHYRLAQLELKANRLDAARWELTQALTIAPNDGRLWKLLGYLAEKQGNPQKAAQFYREAIQPDALINYGRSLETRNQREQALAIYQVVENMAGNDAELLFNLGMIYANLQQANRAEVVLKRFLSVNPDKQDARVAKAISTLKQLGRKASPRKEAKILPY